MVGEIWIFAYGSLIWRPDFEFSERRSGCVRGWSRRFWQASTDHRGVPGAPGRVVTLDHDPDAICWGLAYRVAPEAGDRVLAKLDHRESGGFERVSLEVSLGADRGSTVCAITYVAGPANPNYLGHAPLPEIAEQVRGAHGPSGSNLEYALRLAESLRDHDIDDDHVFGIAELLSRSAPGQTR